MSVPAVRERRELEHRGDAVTIRARSAPRPSNVTLKLVMAITGTIFALFVFVHMVGNLKAFMGPDDYNAYAEFLRTVLYPLFPIGGVLWCFRIVLLVCLVLHVWAGLTIWVRGRRARGKFSRHHMKALGWGARTMVLSGIVILAFVVVHILDLTLGKGVASSSFRGPVNEGTPDIQITAYQNLIASLSRPGMAIFYTVVMVIIGLHICQGVRNTINDFGGTGRRLRTVWTVIGLLIALAIVVCNGALPMLILAGVIS
ncbi:succinate dehydrogenase cytochrome b subunit [Cutibacterium sp.]|uniref:succinate dehydrogenase cytochrome b subunit n=1 Tax=Cutibacterium sp. TaxID=1912221 RepID=UPI0026DC2E68|nr:succinate dehydrogenase cytochrome b subunit [Cutibacterium sp.]MDO4411762.1 succinate dehydrogenase cytochrome b subunit [Cutibacterium sp.]